MCKFFQARPLLGGREYLQLMDPEISSSYDEEQLASLVLVTEKCLRKNPKERFTMNMVRKVTEKLLHVYACVRLSLEAIHQKIKLTETS